MIDDNVVIINSIIFVIDKNIDLILSEIDRINNKDIYNKLISLLNDLIKEKSILMNKIYKNNNDLKVTKIEIERTYKRLKELL